MCRYCLHGDGVEEIERFFLGRHWSCGEGEGCFARARAGGLQGAAHDGRHMGEQSF